MRDALFVFFIGFVVVCNGYDTGPATCNGLNEVSECVKECPPERTCRNREIKFSCIDDKKHCIQKCVCKKGYFRNTVGTCITGAQCDQCCRPNEYFDCNGACDNECAKLDTQNRTNCPIKNIVCNKQCYCEDGYARDSEKNCIPVNECPKKPDHCDNKKCGPNELFACNKTCPPDSCLSIVARFKCDPKEECVNGCYCKPGFLRDESKGKKSPCIPTCQCPQMKNSPFYCKNKQNY